MKWQLMNRNTGKPIELGFEVTTFRGDTYTLTGIRPPHKPGASGKVILEHLGEQAEYYAGAIGAKFIAAQEDGT